VWDWADAARRDQAEVKARLRGLTASWIIAEKNWGKYRGAGETRVRVQQQCEAAEHAQRGIVIFWLERDSIPPQGNLRRVAGGVVAIRESRSGRSKSCVPRKRHVLEQVLLSSACGGWHSGQAGAVLPPWGVFVRSRGGEGADRLGKPWCSRQGKPCESWADL